MEFKRIDMVTLLLVLLIFISGYLTYKTECINQDLRSVIENGITVNIE